VGKITDFRAHFKLLLFADQLSKTRDFFLAFECKKTFIDIAYDLPVIFMEIVTRLIPITSLSKLGKVTF
jgi:hypothetical protein